MPTRKIPARLDADRTAKPKTRIVGHARAGDCIGPGTVRPEALEDVETGARTSLAPEPGPPRKMFEIQNFSSLGARHIVYVRELERLATECEGHPELLATMRANPTDQRLEFKYIMDQIQARLDAIYKLAEVPK